MPPRSPDTGSALAGHFGRNEWTLSSETARHLHPKWPVTCAEIHTRQRRLDVLDRVGCSQRPRETWLLLGAWCELLPSVQSGRCDRGRYSGSSLRGPRCAPGAVPGLGPCREQQICTVMAESKLKSRDRLMTTFAKSCDTNRLRLCRPWQPLDASSSRPRSEDDLATLLGHQDVQRGSGSRIRACSRVRGVRPSTRRAR